MLLEKDELKKEKLHLALEKAIAFKNEGNIEEALEILEVAEEEFGEYTWIEDNRARCYWNLNQFKLALATWEKAVGLASKSDPSETQLIEDAIKKIRERKANEIISAIEDFVQNGTGAAGFDLQKHLTNLCQVAFSVEYYKDQLINLANFYLDNNQQKSALTMWECLAENNPEAWDMPFLQAAIISRDLGLYEHSLEILDKALDKIPNNPWIYDNQARGYVELHQYKKAVDSWGKAIENSEDMVLKEKFISIRSKYEQLLPFRKPEEYLHHQQQDRAVTSKEKLHLALKESIAFRQEGNVEKALEVLEAVEKDFGEYVWIEDNRARCYWQLDQFESALATWEKAIKLASEDNYSEAQQIEDSVHEIRERKSNEIISELGNLVQDYIDGADTKLQEHLNHLNQVALNAWNHKDQIVSLADWYLENEKKNLALITWKWLLGNSAEVWDVAFLQAAKISRELGLYEESMKVIDKALDKIPNNPWLYDSQAHCFLATYQYEEAINSWKKAIESSESKEQAEKFASIKKERFDSVKNELQKLSSEKERLLEENNILKADIQAHKQNIEDRFRELATLTKMLEDQRQELEVLWGKNNKGEMSASEIAKQKMNQQLTTSHVQGNKTVEKLPAVEEELQEMKQENELLLLQLHQVQEELELLYLSQQQKGDEAIK